MHDYDPGIVPYPDGLFWTVPSPAGSVSVQPGAGKGRMRLTDQPITDYFDIPNALFQFEDPVSEDATCSFDVRWSGPVTERYHLTDRDVGFTGQFVLSQATMTWSARNEGGFSFVSDSSPTTSAFAQLGRMRNGVFFEG